MATIPTTAFFCLIYISGSFTAADSDDLIAPRYTIPKSVDEKLYDMVFTENEKEQREAMALQDEEERLATTEDPDAANDKRIRIQMYSRDSGEPTMYQDGALNKRMRLQSMKKRIRLQSLKKRGDEIANVWEPEKRMRLQSLKRSFCGSYEMPSPTEDNNNNQGSNQQQTSEEDKRMRLQSLQKRMRLQSLKRGDEIAEDWEPEKRMRLQSLKRSFCGSYEMPPPTEDNNDNQDQTQQETSEDKRMRLQSLQKRMRLQSLQKRMRLQSMSKRLRLQSL